MTLSVSTHKIDNKKLQTMFANGPGTQGSIPG